MALVTAAFAVVIGFINHSADVQGETIEIRKGLELLLTCESLSMIDAASFSVPLTIVSLVMTIKTSWRALIFYANMDRPLAQIEESGHNDTLFED